MPRFSIAFVAPEDGRPLRHRIIDSGDQESALKRFFEEEASDFYSNDEQGFHYFKEDFFDASNRFGSLIACE
jgi:hypothetical protein